MPEISLVDFHEIADLNFVRTFQDNFGDPTVETYQPLIEAFEHFNKTLFGDQLPRPLLTLRNHGREYRFFAGDQFETPDGRHKRSEIAANAFHFRTCSTEEILQTLVHEMVHLAQHCLPKIFGAPGKRGYHTRRFAAEMEKIGLITSSTGKQGGDRTGYAMADYIQPGGQFERECRALIGRGFTIPYVEQLGGKFNLAEGLAGEVGGGTGADSITGADGKKNASKTKYSCPVSGCSLNVWGKLGIDVICGDHRARLKVAPPQRQKNQAKR